MRSKKVNSININNTCRTCLTEKGDFKYLFDSDLPKILMSCASVDINENDGLPSKICNACVRQLNRFYTFREKIQSSDATLRSYILSAKLNSEKNSSLKRNERVEQESDSIKDELNTSDDDIPNIETDSDNEYVPNKKLILDDKPVMRSKRLIRKTRLNAKRAINSHSLRHIKIKQSLLKVKLRKTLKTEQFEDVINEEYEKENAKEIKSETKTENVSNLFMNEPPPLVPLVPIAPEEIPDFPVDKKSAPVEIALKPISDETPPLVPIKPIVPALEQINMLLVKNSNIPKPKFLCSACNEEFSEPIALRDHMSTHSNIFALACNICKKEFSDRKRLIGHLKGHMVVKHYACKLCGKRYPNPSTFKVHMRTHTGERPFKCQVCGKGFVRWAGVVGHMKSHNSNKPYKCDVCQRGFKIQSNLERHKILHSGSMPYCCSYCGKTFTQNDNLQLHVRTYHTNERPYLCSECGKGFVSSTRLNRHMWVHSGYKPYVCHICDKAYSNSNDLKNHEKSHTGGPRDADKPHACPSCDMRFFHPCRLAKHIKTHERPFVCPECPKTFSREDILNKHAVNKHGDTQVYRVSIIDATDLNQETANAIIYSAIE